MTSVFPKFIIETDDNGVDNLIVSKCTYHKQLVIDPSKIRGGGYFVIDRNNPKIMFLYGNSYDFGKARIDDIRNCIANGRVFNTKSKHRNIAKDYEYYYRTETGEHIPLSK